LAALPAPVAGVAAVLVEAAGVAEPLVLLEPVSARAAAPVPKMAAPTAPAIAICFHMVSSFPP
jgi:hypothetical protein